MIRTACALTCVLVAAVACRRDAAANQAPETTRGAESPAAVANPQAAAVAQARFDEAAFTLTIAPKGVPSKGQSGEVAVVLQAKAPFHVNQEYPHRFKVTDLRGLTTPANVVQRDPGKLTPARLELVVPVTLGQSAPFGLDGEMAFSLCTDEKCLMEKRLLSVAIGPS